MLNLDTHILLGLLFGELRDREQRLIHGESLAISDIVLWEIAKLAQRGRIDIDFDDPKFIKAMRQVTVYPVSVEIARQSTELDFRSDPADEIIAATSVVERIPLLTRDRKILKSKVVPLAGDEFDT
jgi:PIN domain nuclease of toxin-antitoxin system